MASAKIATKKESSSSTDMDTVTQLRLLQIASYIADKNMVIATANAELAKGGWLSDHQKHIDMLNSDIDSLTNELLKYS